MDTRSAPHHGNEQAARLFQAALEIAKEAHRSPLAADVRRLHRLFTTERSDRRPLYLQERPLLRAYLGYFAPLNAMKVALLLRMLEQEGRLSLPPRPRVVDLGAGPLSGILGVWVATGAVGEALAVDVSKQALAHGEAWLERSRARGEIASLETRVASITGSPARFAPTWKSDLVILANVLVELGEPRRTEERRLALLRAALSFLGERGRLLVVEPGTRVSARALQRLRDRLAETGEASILAPCTGAARCPLLERQGDWCHHELPWSPPPPVRALERAAGLDRQALTLSYLLLASAAEAENTSGLRLVGGVMRDDAGEERRYACTSGGLVTLRGRSGPLPEPAFAAPRGALLEDAPSGVVVERERQRPKGRQDKPRSRSRRRRGSGAS